ncbi:MAG: DUF1499 domain-containing protein [Chloroflexota bacterium]
MKRLLIVVGVLAVAVVGFILAVRSYKPPTPENLGATNGQLAPCPDSPNCVSSYATDPEHAMDPLPLTGSASEAQDQLSQIVMSMPRTEIVVNEPGYIRAEFRSQIMDFMDDVEFYIDEEAQVVHFRAAARLGRSDLGVNRQRMEEIGTAFATN